MKKPNDHAEPTKVERYFFFFLTETDLYNSCMVDYYVTRFFNASCKQIYYPSLSTVYLCYMLLVLLAYFCFSCGNVNHAFCIKKCIHCNTICSL